MLPHNGLEGASKCGHIRLPDRRLRVGVKDAAAMDHQDQDGGRAGSLRHLGQYQLREKCFKYYRHTSASSMVGRSPGFLAWIETARLSSLSCHPATEGSAVNKEEM